MKTRRLQQIFTAVINAGHYPSNYKLLSSGYMCVALQFAKREEVITRKEYYKAAKAINNYINHLLRNSCIDWTTAPSLCFAWQEARINKVKGQDHLSPIMKAALLQCFKDWKNRPYK